MVQGRRPGGWLGGTVSRRLSEAARAGMETGDTADIPARLRAALAQVAEALGGAEGGVLAREGAIDTAEGARAVFGYTVRFGLDGVRAEPFGDAAPVRRGAKGPARTPITDVFEEERGLRIVAELPGSVAALVRCAAEPRALDIAAEGTARFAKRLTLPREVDPATLTWRCDNGIFEATLDYAA